MLQGLATVFESGNNAEANGRRECYSVVSKGCMIIHVPKSRFVDLADEASLELVRKEVRHYPSEQVLLQRFIDNNLWDAYKQVRIRHKIISKLSVKG